jgi:DNA-binding transcriptional ArsR family regulator
VTEPNDLDRLFGVMADPHRRSFVERLCRGPASVKELAAPTQVQLPAVLKHLKVLEEGGIVVSTKTGRTRTYRMRKEALAGMADWIEKRQQEMNLAFDRLAAAMLDVPEGRDH